ncbi:MAG: carboxylating nicotinate-nucleotide diphosphorylase [Microscillaceae bacterium]|nr:carboxylating nicotinate-nucleotide diphosphorylase [Microscillaceae bacterium]
MKYEYLTEKYINQFIDLALQEDVGEGDHSSLAAVPPQTVERAKLIIKGDGIIAGVEMARYILHRVDADMDIEFLVMDGQPVKYGDIGFYVSGNAQTILKAERLVLNCMQRMSGIATFTHELVQKIKHTRAKLLDTRKTTPNFRLAEKWAVKIGGATNHRFGLFDMIMLKDNHIDYAGGITSAIRQAQDYVQTTGKDLKIEVETRNLVEVEEVLQAGGVEVIMLDNFHLDDLHKAVELINHQYKTEASGGITRETIVPIAETGVDFISVGALTHSIQSMDISLKAVR